MRRHGGTFPVPPEFGGGTITIPVHDKTLPRRIPAVRPADCFGSFVLAAADAPAGSVATRTDPNGSGKELAVAIVLGQREILLDARWTVELGLALGLLEVESIGWGGSAGPVPCRRDPPSGADPGQPRTVRPTFWNSLRSE